MVLALVFLYTNPRPIESLNVASRLPPWLSHVVMPSLSVCSVDLIAQTNFPNPTRYEIESMTNRLLGESNPPHKWLMFSIRLTTYNKKWCEHLFVNKDSYFEF